ncbi:Na(+)-translocating NADH-quinone reductase subunit E [uncultured spirochete]|jgi:Na+-transporting NADH:ubiquinone oxidoreductase subunit E|uniref:Na(+)-translocating NADH-quinone reductase subunit E n=1 Tax=uncultured spirochete TaxID=156406 RepID=A0A3P3XJJ4_9SPIR|nr:Rnf-Nqr domain containing protein [Rectinema subterraneum]SLM13778.1 Na(+)-translocating NADH-quinone reductase subunit E [uncultured spirochete]
MIDAPSVGLLSLFLASILTSNVLLANFLGTCSFISISKDFKSSMGLGVAVTLVIGITAAVCWAVLYFIIQPLGIEYLSFIIFIIVIAGVVQMLEMIIDRFSPALYLALGIFLPLITVNCAVLGVILFMQIRKYSFPQAVIFGFGSGAGWWLAIMLLASIRKKLDSNNAIPAGLKGTGITLITIGFMAMAFVGFSGMIAVQ